MCVTFQRESTINNSYQHERERDHNTDDAKGRLFVI